jgi:hypothetical protein
MQMPNAQHLSDQQFEFVVQWHREEPDFAQISNEDPFALFFESNHMCNYKLWHEEDEARRTDVDDSTIARVKRAIDAWNQKRNDFIEKMDETFIHFMQNTYERLDHARQHSETVGGIIDKLSIINLKIYHMNELVEAYPSDTKYKDKVATLLQQRSDLVGCLNLLLADIEGGRRYIKIYRQMKMYNDPTTNAAINKDLRRV